ncbi:MAG: hypothetical protein QHH06_08845 [Clostridiales bacterium]|nr:hypothetical protein [Eubacteriales bacterium]MDH7566572.1 hypothetical protein [Clostridiales bacterium]
MTGKIFRVEILAVLWAAAVMISMLMVKPIIGVADNGDFSRIMGQTGLEYISSDRSDRYFGYVNREYKMTHEAAPGRGYFSSEVLLVWLAKLLNCTFTLQKQIFDIRFLSFIYICTLLLSFYLIIKSAKGDAPLLNIAAAAAFIFTFTDIAYISYFNSFYGEAVSFSFLLLSTGWALWLARQQKYPVAALAAFFTAALFFVAAKVQYAPVGLLVAFFGIRLMGLRKDKVWRFSIAFFCALMVVASMTSYLSVPEGIRVCNKYQTVFYGVLKDSPDPRKDLEELGMDPGLAVLAGTNYFMQQYPLDIKDPAFSKEISEKVNPLKIALFYAKHPSRFLRKLQTAAKYGFDIMQGFGNYEKAPGIEYGKTAKSLGLWSNLRLKILPRSLGFVASFYAVYFAVLLIRRKKADTTQLKLFLEILMLIGLIGASQFVVPLIGDGEADLSKHMFLFNVCFDMMLVVSFTGLLNAAAGWLKRFFQAFPGKAKLC